MMEDKNPRFGIEQHGFDFVPENERTMTPKEAAFLWVGAQANLTVLATGVILLGLGLTVGQALIAMVLGNLFFAYVAFASIAGVRAGLPTMTLTRAAYGMRGNRIQAFFSWLVSVAFEALNTVFGVFAFLALFNLLGWQEPGVGGDLLALAIVFGLSAGVAVLGHATMVYLQQFFAVALTVTLATVFLFTVGGTDWGAGSQEPLPTAAAVGVFLVGMRVVVAGPLSYLFVASDWLRYLPSGTPSRTIFWSVLPAAGGISIFVGVTGVVLASQADMTDPVVGVQPLVPAWLFLAYVFAVIGGIVANNVVTFYSSGLIMQSMGIPLRRYQATMVDAVVASGLVLYVLFVQDFTAALNNILAFVVVWVGPFAGVWLADGVLRRWRYDPLDIHSVGVGSGGRYWGWHGFNVKGFVAFAVGVAVCLLTLNLPNFQGPVSRALAGSDLGWLLGPLTSAAVYYALGGREARDAGAVDVSERQREASTLVEEDLIGREHPGR